MDRMCAGIHAMTQPTLTRRLLTVLLLGLLLLPTGRHLLHRYDAALLAVPIAGLDAPRTMVVAPGSALKNVARALAGDGLLEHPSSWVREARRENLAGRIRAGEYRIEPGTTPRYLLDMMVAGRVMMHSVTVPEGWTYQQALSAVQAHPAITVELKGVPADEVRARVGFDPVSPEGLFFPDTYLFQRGATDLEVARQAYQRMQDELAAAWRDRTADLPLASPYEALVLASLIEKETGVPDERPLIGGVFINRLRLGMRLQTDPTVIYGLGESFDGNLRRADLLRDTPYNTYTRSGLPPTPIALPGRDALRAAVQPAATEALYFVATGLGDGRHRFASTLQQHNDNVARYIATLRSAAHERTH